MDGRALGARLRRALGDRVVPGTDAGVAAGVAAEDGAEDRVEDALDALEALLDLDWVEPHRVEALLAAEEVAGGPGVRSLAEDLAVARLRARTAGLASRRPSPARAPSSPAPSSSPTPPRAAARPPAGPSRTTPTTSRRWNGRWSSCARR